MNVRILNCTSIMHMIRFPEPLKTRSLEIQYWQSAYSDCDRLCLKEQEDEMIEIPNRFLQRWIT